MNYHFIELENDGRVFQQLAVAWDGEGPPAPPDPLPGNTIRFLPEPGEFARPSEDAFLVWTEDEPAPVWTDPRTLAEAIDGAVVKVDAAADAARSHVVGDGVRVKEYEQARAQAEAFRAAGFEGPVPDDVACWASAKRWTAQQATEDILAAAARWLGALSFIRNLRLNAKEDIRRAGDNATVDALLATFTATLDAAMQGVQ